VTVCRLDSGLIFSVDRGSAWSLSVEVTVVDPTLFDKRIKRHV